MSKSLGVNMQIEPLLKEEAEKILSKLGIPVDSAVNLFLHQIILHGGIPFDVKLPKNAPVDYSALTKEQFDREIEKGMKSIAENRFVSSEKVRSNIGIRYEL